MKNKCVTRNEEHDSKIGFPLDKSIHHLFEEQVIRTPNNVALIYKDNYMTYHELNSKANIMARCLLNKGIKKGDVVAILLDKSFELIVSIIAIVKLGATYLPLELNCPDERLIYMLNDSNVSLIISKDRNYNNSRFDGKKLFYVDEALIRSDISDENLCLPYDPERTIYVIYTSGSTGVPKGVMIKSYSFTNLLNWFTKQFEISNNDKILLFTSISFDLTQKNIFCTLISGGSLYLYPQSSYNPRLISDLICKYHITLLNCTPSAFLPLLNYGKKDDYDKLKSLRYLFLGGETLNLKPFLMWMNSLNYNCEIVNTYGPTECTDIALFYIIDNNKDNITTVPIGKSIYNVNLYLIDEHNNLVDENIEGELYIGGIGVGIGYINHDELTNERFVNIPHISTEKMYKTGDIVKRLHDGNIEYIGRIDNQVKLHGFRIELEEIETCLNQFSTIKQSIVIISNINDTEKVLEAFYTADADIIKDDILEYLSKRLPQYMIPRRFIKINEFPLTQNGKIDRKIMCEVNKNLIKEPLKKPQDKTIDSNLSEIKIKVLELFNLNIGQKIFADINLDTNLSDIELDSLSFMKIIVQLEETFNFEFNDDMLDVNRFTNINSVAKYIESKC